MPAQLSLTDVTQEQFDAAERVVIDLIRSAYPTLDQRKGTVLRDTLIRPDASLAALNVERVERLRRIISLSTMLEDGTATVTDVNAILANFNMHQLAGTYSTGSVRVKVDAVRTYTLAPGFTFVSLDGLQYRVQTLTVVKQNATTSLGELPLLTATDNSYYFVVPVVAAAIGNQYNIAQGTALDTTIQLYGFISAAAYVNFTSGQDTESIQNAVSRIPASLSHRGLTNRTAIEAQLRARFDDTGLLIQALNVQGYGDAAQCRDKHNVFGVAVGGRADIYVRTFTDPPIVTLTKTATRTEAGTYQFTIDAADAPGYYAIRSVTDVDGLALSSYQFTDIRTAYGINDTWHDISSDNGLVETAYSVFQDATITVTGVPGSASTYTFKVELYCMSGLTDLQTYVDDQAVRNVAADFIVRCPLICLVTCTANVYYPLASPVDTEGLKSKLTAYINSRSFVSRLTRSELASVLLAEGVTRVELGTQGMQLEGRVRDAGGTWHTLNGDSLDLTAIEDAATMLTPDTCVFAAEVQNIHLIGIGE